MAEARSGATHAYGYDAAGRMATFQINGFLQASYKYDAMGRQAIRTLTAGPVTIHSVFDSQGRRIAEYNETSGALIREYIWNGREPIALIEGGVVYFVRADHIGRPVFATNAGGVTVWSASYLPFGEVHVATGALPDNRFPGQWYQSESGLHQNWMRDYDPTTGRYLQADPLGLVDGASVYGYVRQNPGRWVDPKGEWTGNPFFDFLCLILGGGLDCIVPPQPAPEPQMCHPGLGDVNRLSPPILHNEPNGGNPDGGGTGGSEGAESEEASGPNEDGSVTINTPSGPIKTYSSTDQPTPLPPPPEKNDMGIAFRSDLWMKVIRRIISVRSILLWWRALLYMKAGDFYHASQLLEMTRLPDGDAQIARIHLANCYYRMNMPQKAVSTYRAASDAERNSGAKRGCEDSRFIIEYCDFFVASIERRAGVESRSILPMYQTLISLRISDRLRGLLPLPNRSSLSE